MHGNRVGKIKWLVLLYYLPKIQFNESGIRMFF
jgi:hypothetical protein